MTVKNCRNRWAPITSFWGTQEEWEKKGSQDASHRANQMARQILLDAPDSLIDKALDKALLLYMEYESQLISKKIKS
jgi:trimethylamine:corrinoid methyltransferase-like protein